MIHSTDLAGLVSVASALSAAMLLLPQVARGRRSHLALLPGIFLALLLIPFGDLPIAGYVRGVTGDLSITTQVLLWCALLRLWCDCGALETGTRRPLLMLIALAALALYPMALGAGAFDPYRMGYGDPLFVAALLLIALAAWYQKYLLVVLCISLATLAWAVGWQESANLWDYLLDPFVAVYALAALMMHAVKARSQATSR